MTFRCDFQLSFHTIFLASTLTVFLSACQGGKQYFGSDGPHPVTDDTATNDIRPDSESLRDPSSDGTNGDSSDTAGTTDPSDTATDRPDATDTSEETTDEADTTTETVPDPRDTNVETDDSETPPDTDAPDSESDEVPDTGTETDKPKDSEPLDSDTETFVDTDEHLDSEAVPFNVPEVQIEISAEAKAQLESDPFNSPKVSGGFVDASGKHYDVELNYRGAYALQGLIDQGKVQRNWKVKFSKTDKYQNRREWNFNYEPSVRQKLAYDLLKFAGVKMPSPRHVRLLVNGEAHGVYLQWEDPDSKDWLYDRFGDDEGDLYKAAYDIPNEVKYFADLTYLGDADEDYFYHYDKKTNNDLLPDDYSVLRGFIYDLNFTPEEEFVDWMQCAFNWDSFITYLAVSNFISNWDGYPQRPKNFWLYNNPSTEMWTFIPWDLDNTFQLYMDNLDQMGTEASIFYQFDEFEPYELQEGESEERPLVRKMMVFSEFRDTYIARYKELMSGVLKADYIADRATRLTELVLSVANDEDGYTAKDAESEIREFATRRHENVAGQLSAY